MFLPKERAPEYLVRRINDKLSYNDLLIFPSYVYLEVTADCNAACRMCPFAHNLNRFMSDEMFDKCAEEVIKYKSYLKYCVVQCRGEPLLDPKLEQRVKLLSAENNVPTMLSTNAELLDEGRAENLLKGKLGSIVLSIDSLNKENYEKIRHGLDFNTVLKNIHRFIELRDRINPDTQVRVRMIEQEPNMGEWEPYEKYWLKLLKPGDRVTFKRIHAWGGKLKLNEVRNVDSDQDAFPCVALWSYFAILYNGDIPLCPGDDAIENHTIKNIREGSIAEIWKDMQFMKYRESHLNGKKIPAAMCNNCRIYAEPSDMDHIGRQVFPEYYRK